jgi:hypothetical protein
VDPGPRLPQRGSKYSDLLAGHHNPDDIPFAEVPVGRQVRFVLEDRELGLLEQHLRDVGASFVPRSSETHDLDPQPGLAGSMYIIRAEDLRIAKREYVATPLADPPRDGYWGLARDDVPRIDYLPLVRSSGYGRLWFDPTRFVDHQVVWADPSFVRWADGILNWVRRTFTYDPDAQLYVGSVKGGERNPGADPAHPT